MHRVEAIDADDLVFIAEGSDVTKVAIHKGSGDRQTVLEAWITREVWQELCRRIAPPPLRDVCDCDETPHERGSGMCAHPPETF